MRASPEPPPEHLEDTSIVQCEFIGYRLLGRSIVGVALSVFAEQSKSSPKSFFYQRKGNNDRVASFVRDRNLQLAEIVLISGRDLAVRIGDEFLHTYVSADGRLICAQGQEFRAELEKLISGPEASQSPFRSLEIARFLRMPVMEEQFGGLCFKNLSTTSKSLAISWMAGNNLSPEARSGAYQELIKLDLAPGEKKNLLGKGTPQRSQTSKHDPHPVSEIDFSQPLDALRAHGFELRQRKEIEASILVFRGILERFPTLPRSWLDLAHVLRKAERNSEAYKIYMALLHRFPDEIDGIAEAIVALRKMGHLVEVRKLYENLNEKFPNDPRPLVGMGDAYVDMGDTTGGANAYRQAFHVPDLDVQTAVGIARKLSRIIDRHEVISLATELEARYPLSWHARRMVAELLYSCKLIEETILAYQEAIKLNAHNPNLKFSLAKVYARFGRHREAVDIYEQIVSGKTKMKKKVIVGLSSSLDALGEVDRADEVRKKFSTIF